MTVTFDLLLAMIIFRTGLYQICEITVQYQDNGVIRESRIKGVKLSALS